MTDRIPEMPESADDGTLLQKPVDRREALGLLLGGLAAGAAAVGACTPLSAATPEERELKLLEWEEFTQKHYRRMTEEERAETIQRLERLAKLRHNEDVHHRHHRCTAGSPLRLRLQHFEVQGVPALRRGLHQREQSRPATRTRSTSGSSRWRTAWSISTTPMRPTSTRCRRRATSISAPSASSAPTRPASRSARWAPPGRSPMASW